MPGQRERQRPSAQASESSGHAMCLRCTASVSPDIRRNRPSALVAAKRLARCTCEILCHNISLALPSVEDAADPITNGESLQRIPVFSEELAMRFFRQSSDKSLIVSLSIVASI